MNNKMYQINEATNKYVKEYNERLPNIRHIIQNSDEYSGDAQLLSEASKLFSATLNYVQSVEKITESKIIKTVELVDKLVIRR